jgi:anti-sigma regulatory factor (Ser/Thr protein kinase)
MSKVIQLSMQNSANELIQLMNRANGFLESHSLPQRTLYKANLVLEEVLTNIIKYAFDDSAAHEIGVVLALQEDGLFIEVADDGAEFDPLAIPAPEMKNSILEAEVGGLGVHLVRRTVDSIHYRRNAARNILSMTLGLQS